jgi:hypothetical protein
MRYFAVGSQKKKGLDGEVAFVNVMIPLTETSRVGAVNQANRIARRDKITLDGVYLLGGPKDSGGILTKNMKKQKASKR